MSALQELLQVSAAFHPPCPRQVLGVRMGLLAGCCWGDVPRRDRRLLRLSRRTAVRRMGFRCDGCRVGGRTLRVSTRQSRGDVCGYTDGCAVRIVPALTAARVRAYVPSAGTGGANLTATSTCPTASCSRAAGRIDRSPGKRSANPVIVSTARLAAKRSSTSAKYSEGVVLCRSCAGERYFRPVTEGVAARLEAARP